MGHVSRRPQSWYHVPMSASSQVNRVLTCYFTSKRDPLPGRACRDGRDPQKYYYKDPLHLLPDRFGLMSGWYNSMARLGLSGVVFHDGLSEDFVSRLSTDRIRFVPVMPGPRPLNDERFFIYHDYLQQHGEVRNVFATDLFDVAFFKDPFLLLNKSHDLWAGSEKRYNWFWMRRRYKLSYGKMHHTSQKLLNAGIMGGTRENLLTLFARMTADMTAMPPSVNANMAVFNKCAYDLFMPERIFTGFPLHSVFRKYEAKGDFFIRHK